MPRPGGTRPIKPPDADIHVPRRPATVHVLQHAAQPGHDQPDRDTRSVGRDGIHGGAVR